MSEYLDAVNELLPLHQKIADLNPALGKVYPVAVVVGDEFLIYDAVSNRGPYHFIKRAPVPMPIPAGIRAAFQLADYGGRIACVVTPEVFETREGYVTILHEFVHCYQYETCEQDLKMQLDIAQQAKEKGDVMWEIQHPFPYTAESFVQPYARFMEAIGNENEQDIRLYRKRLKTYLGLHDYEYMVWQEWKEGFARWVENTLQARLCLPVKRGGLQLPYSRVLFYVGGAAYIDYISGLKPEIVNDLPTLFKTMFEV